MKKFMKAIAFALVMCLALSTVAFAAGTATDADYDKIVDITVTGAGNDQVALVVVAKDAGLSNPLYIDQKGSENNSVSFQAVLTNTSVEEVDVYVGYATYAATGATTPEKIGTVKLVAPIVEVTIAKVDTEIVQGGEENGLKAEEQTGAGVAIEFSVKAPEGVSATQMIWAIRYTDAEGPKVKYTDAMDATGYGIGSELEGNITLGLAFLNGSELNEIDPVEITDVDVIFMFSNKEVEFTNNLDADNEAPKAN